MAQGGDGGYGDGGQTGQGGQGGDGHGYGGQGGGQGYSQDTGYGGGEAERKLSQGSFRHACVLLAGATPLRGGWQPLGQCRGPMISGDVFAHGAVLFGVVAPIS